MYPEAVPYNSDRPKPIEADKTKSISEMTMEELIALNRRLYEERSAQDTIINIRRNGGEKIDYDNLPKINTTTPVNQLYHWGILGMKWGIRKGSGSSSTGADSIKFPSSKQIKTLSDEELRSLTNRMQLESNFRRLSKDLAEPSKASTFINGFVKAGTVANDLYKLYTNPLGIQIREMLGFPVDSKEKKSKV